ncbi:helix-turn-helix domain-containing protein [Vibrio sp. S9_S30]|uniref:helix-turn-helix domain-containing protein n=1 Tax=Vibrio sp. S9_S30 TaxID=2720226 RepID=UPI0016806C72|nr:helix-turn-helix domain-containing protein [Vibrio sp. S9_S30]MBD1557236.1 helix-turn-helix domain-containing protein [Vibrio sp. S9_S30]
MQSTTQTAKSEYLLMALRQTIKDEGITYNTLAQQLGVPLSSLKRHLHNPSIPLEKLLTYCVGAGINLSELHQVALKLQFKNENFFNEIQDDVFFEFPQLYDFYRELRHRENELHIMQEEYGLDDACIYLYLRALEILGLIQLGESNRFSFIGPYHYQMSSTSKLSRQYLKNLKQQALEAKDAAKVICGRMYLSDEQLEAIETKLNEEILRTHNENMEHGRTEPQHLRNMMFFETKYKKILFSDGIGPLPNDVLNRVKNMISEDGNL